MTTPKPGAPVRMTDEEFESAVREGRTSDSGLDKVEAEARRARESEANGDAYYWRTRASEAESKLTALDSRLADVDGMAYLLRQERDALTHRLADLETTAQCAEEMRDQAESERDALRVRAMNLEDDVANYMDSEEKLEAERDAWKAEAQEAREAERQQAQERIAEGEAYRAKVEALEKERDALRAQAFSSKPNPEVAYDNGRLVSQADYDALRSQLEEAKWAASWHCEGDDCEETASTIAARSAPMFCTKCYHEALSNIRTQLEEAQRKVRVLTTERDNARNAEDAERKASFDSDMCLRGRLEEVLASNRSFEEIADLAITSNITLTAENRDLRSDPQAALNKAANYKEMLETTHGQVAEMCRYLDPTCAAPDAWSLRDLIKAARDRIGALEGALKKYGHHIKPCHDRKDWSKPCSCGIVSCLCGFDAALAPAPDKAQIAGPCATCGGYSPQSPGLHAFECAYCPAPGESKEFTQAHESNAQGQMKALALGAALYAYQVARIFVPPREVERMTAAVKEWFLNHTAPGTAPTREALTPEQAADMRKEGAALSDEIARRTAPMKRGPFETREEPKPKHRPHGECGCPGCEPVEPRAAPVAKGGENHE